MTKKQLIKALDSFPDDAIVLVNRDLASDPLGSTRTIAEVIAPNDMLQRDIECSQRENVSAMVNKTVAGAFLILGPGEDYSTEIEPAGVKEVKDGKTEKAS